MSGRYRAIKKSCCFEIKYKFVRSRRGLEEERKKDKEEMMFTPSLLAIDGALITAVRTIKTALIYFVVHPLIKMTLVNSCRIHMNKFVVSNHNSAAWRGKKNESSSERIEGK